MKTLTSTIRHISIPFTREYAIEWHIRRVFFVFIVALVLGYGYFLSATVLHVVARKDAHTHIAELQTKISSLEAEYFALSEQLSPQYAASLGLVPPHHKHFVPRAVQYASAQGVHSGSF